MLLGVKGSIFLSLFSLLFSRGGVLFIFLEKGTFRLWRGASHADFGDGLGSFEDIDEEVGTYRFWRGEGVTCRILARSRGNLQQNMLLHGCFSKEKHKWPRTPGFRKFLNCLFINMQWKVKKWVYWEKKS